MKKPIEINKYVPGTFNEYREADLRGGHKQVNPVGPAKKIFERISCLISRKFMLAALLLGFSVTALAPENNVLVIPGAPVVNPFTELIYATGMVETLLNPAAYNPVEEAVGIFQIRQVRVDDYNRRTGSNYKLADMYDYKVSEKIFLYFASLTGPYDFEKISRSWNGSGPMTEIYWSRIKTYLD